MPRKLFIVEAPGKVAKIQGYLGKDYLVVPSVGHTYYLPTKNYCDFKNDFQLLYEPDPKKKDVLKTIVVAAKSCDEIMLATDQDTEGSCIAYHIWKHLEKNYKGKTKTYTRVNLKEITKAGIQIALKNTYPMNDPKELNMVASGFLRRIEDRFVGFKISPLANIYIQEKTSAGRVQSPALRILVEREKEIQNFKPKVYYEIFAKVFPQKTTDVFTAKYAKEVVDPKVASLIVSQCKGKIPTVTSINKKQTSSRAQSPFVTKTLLQAASTILGWKTDRATRVAQSLYQGGHITYIRTDNPVISDDGKKILKSYLAKNFPKQYIALRLPDYDNKKAKLEHECIRPTDLNAKPMLDADGQKLYEIIRARFLASGMSPATYDNVTADIKIGTHIFKAAGSVQTFDGYLKVWIYTKRTDTILPPLDKSMSLQLRDIYDERKETKPPPRYKGASLIDALDKYGIGRPSTLDSIMKTLESREYITYQKNAVVPTELGIRLNDFLVQYFDNVSDFDFTARVEDDQEKVMLGELQYKDVIAKFYQDLKEEIKRATVKIAADKDEKEKTTLICPKCNDNLLMKKLNRRDGVYFYSCSGYQDKSCLQTYGIGENGEPVETRAQVEVLSACPRKGCTGSLTKRMNKTTKEYFYACTAWRKEDGGCKITADADGNVRQPKKLKKHGRCSKCKKGSMVERTNKSNGAKFLACDSFPSCRNVENIT